MENALNNYSLFFYKKPFEQLSESEAEFISSCVGISRTVEEIKKSGGEIPPMTIGEVEG